MPEQLVGIHVNAVINRINKSYSHETILENVKKLGVNSIEEFLKADVNTLRLWTSSEADLSFTWFKDIYNKYFSNGSTNYVDGDYNAYKFLDLLNVTVCPYCDDEYLNNKLKKKDGKSARTSEVDHFFPKSKYPGLAMCIYNLVPSGQNCNGLKKEDLIGENPYEAGIENDTWLYPDLEIGRLMENVKPDECKLYFHPKNGMKSNVSVLCLEQRYDSYKNEVYNILLKRQHFTKEKVYETAKLLGINYEKANEMIFGTQDPEVQRKSIHSKMKKDLLGTSRESIK